MVNENDTVATHEIRFGDNDRLAALVAHLVRADALVLLSDVDALYDGAAATRGARRIPLVRGPDDLDGVRIGSARRAPASAPAAWSPRSRRPRIAARPGSRPVTSAAQAAAALAGDDVGTLVPGSGTRAPSRLLWLAHAARTEGRLVLDDGAVAAVVDRRHLAAAGRHHRGSRAASRPATRSSWPTPDGRVVARGLVKLRRRRTAAAARPLDPRDRARTRPRLRAGARAPGRPCAPVKGHDGRLTVTL